MEQTKIAAAFIKAQNEMGNAVKDSSNPFFKSKYADLNAVREACIPALNKHNIAVLQPTVQIEGKNFVKTILLHESGETIESLTEILFTRQGDAQAQGSGITYARRYGLQSLVCIGAEDDDGNKAAEQPKKKEFFKKEANTNIATTPEEKRVLAEEFFRETKAKFEAEFGSLAEVEGLVEQNAKGIKSLAKYPDLSAMLNEAIDNAKLAFVGEV